MEYDAGSDDERKEAEALIQRLQAQFGDVDLDLELLGLGDEEDVARELKHLEDAEASADQARTTDAPAAGGGVSDAEAAALMARLGAQFGDLDMSQLGLGVVAGGNTNDTTQADQNPAHDRMTNSDILDHHSGSSDEESSLEEPTPEELAAWQASQFSKGRDERSQKQRKNSLETSESIQQWRRRLRNRRAEQLTREQARIRLQHTRKTNEASPSESFLEESKPSILDLLGDDTSAFFGPSTARVLEELVSEETHGDAEILRASWKRLYASYEQGLGFWNLWKALRGYDGPTLLVLRCSPSASKSLATTSSSGAPPPTACLGFYTTTPWKESTDFYGGDIHDPDGDRAFLFAIDKPQKGSGKPETSTSSSVKFFPLQKQTLGATTGTSSGYMYCQPSVRSDGANRTHQSNVFAATGLGVGGRPTRPRFHLTETFEDCSCMTYDSGRATMDGDLFACFGDNNSDPEGHAFARALYCFDVTELEAWGLGGSDWIEHALRQRQRERELHIERFQKVDKRMMWDQGGFAARRNSNMANVSRDER